MSTIANEHAQAIRTAERAHRELDHILASRLGTLAHPRGEVLSAYRVAQRALRDVFRDDFNVPANTAEVLRQLRIAVRASVQAALRDARTVGRDTAVEQMQIYDAVRRPLSGFATSQVATQALEVVSLVVERQAAQVQTLVVSGATPAQIIGDDSRVGLVSPGVTTRAAAEQVAGMLWIEFDDTISRVSALTQKQAVAALDERTTDNCLRVHSQIQPINEPFELTGVPRFADEIMRPPFHWWCRTAYALYDPSFEEGLTGDMRSSANTILAERAAGKSGFRHPASATA